MPHVQTTPCMYYIITLHHGEQQAVKINTNMLANIKSKSFVSQYRLRFISQSEAIQIAKDKDLIYFCLSIDKKVS